MRSTSRTAPAEGGPPGLFCKLGGRCNQKTRRVRECESIAPEIRKVMDWARQTVNIRNDHVASYSYYSRRTRPVSGLLFRSFSRQLVARRTLRPLAPAMAQRVVPPLLCTW